MATLTVREYHPSSGALLGNISVLAFGKIASGTTSRVKVIDIAFTEVTQIGNIKMGIISNGGLIVNASPTNISSDGSSSNGHFGIENSSNFESSKASQPLSRHFAGTNTTITSSNSNNVSVGNRSSTISNYIYLDIEMGASSVGQSNGSYKIFFDYS